MSLQFITRWFSQRYIPKQTDELGEHSPGFRRPTSSFFAGCRQQVLRRSSTPSKLQSVVRGDKRSLLYLHRICTHQNEPRFQHAEKPLIAKRFLQNLPMSVWSMTTSSTFEIPLTDARTVRVIFHQEAFDADDERWFSAHLQSLTSAPPGPSPVHAPTKTTLKPH